MDRLIETFKWIETDFVLRRLTERLDQSKRDEQTKISCPKNAKGSVNNQFHIGHHSDSLQFKTTKVAQYQQALKLTSSILSGSISSIDLLADVLDSLDFFDRFPFSQTHLIRL